MHRSHRLIPVLAVTLFLTLVVQITGSAQGGQGRHGRGGDGQPRAGGPITAISGNVITVTRCDGTTLDILVTETTTFIRNGASAVLADFVVGDFVKARGALNASGQLVAERVIGGDTPRGGHDADHHTGGQVAAVDITAGTITVTRRDGKTDTIYITDTTEFVRNRQQATLADLAVGDYVFAHGERDEDGRFVAERVIGSSEPLGGPHSGRRP
jgi:hypothetical protein